MHYLCSIKVSDMKSTIKIGSRVSNRVYGCGTVTGISTNVRYKGYYIVKYDTLTASSYENAHNIELI